MNVPFDFDETLWGEIQQITEVEKGVFEIAAKHRHDIVCRELYVVVADAVPEIISEETISYGTAIKDATVFLHEKDGNGWELVDYELSRFRAKLRPSEESREELFSAMAYTAEKYPAYFGGMIPPRSTPWGLTLRVKKAAEGVYFLETDAVEWVLAVANIIWTVDLSDSVQKLGSSCDMDRRINRQEAEYLYFRKENWGPVVYELLDYSEYRGLLQYISSKEALETLLYLQHPKYTLLHNQTQTTGNGKSDLLTNLLACLGDLEDMDEEASEEVNQRRMDCCLHYYPDLVNETVFLLPE